jgi:hypothetical protein
MSYLCPVFGLYFVACPEILAFVDAFLDATFVSHDTKRSGQEPLRFVTRYAKTLHRKNAAVHRGKRCSSPSLPLFPVEQNINDYD